MRTTAFTIIALLTGLLFAGVLKSQTPVIYSVIDNDSSGSQFISEYNLQTHANQTVFQLLPDSIVGIGGSGGSSIDPYNNRYFFTNGTTDSIFLYDITNSKLTTVPTITPSIPNEGVYVCGSLVYDQFMNALVWITYDDSRVYGYPNVLQCYLLDSGYLNSYSLTGSNDNFTCSGMPTAYNSSKEQLFSIAQSDSIVWFLLDLPSQQVLVDQVMPDSMDFTCIEYSPVTGKYYGYLYNTLYSSGVYQIDPLNLSAVKIAPLPNYTPGNGSFFPYGLFDEGNNIYMFQCYNNSLLDTTYLAAYNLTTDSMQILPFWTWPGPDRSEILSEPLSANIIYHSGRLFVTTGQSYKWYFKDSVIQNTTINSYVPTQTGYYRADVTTVKNTYHTDSLYVDITDIPGINDFDIEILPNPATDKLIIKANNCQPDLISIYDITGHQVMQEKYTTPQVDVSSIISGVYFIEIKNTNQTRVQRKFVKVD